MINSLKQVEESVVDVKTEIEELDNAILELHTEIFERIQTQFSNLDDELSNIGGLFEDFDVTDGKGNWSNEGITRLGLLTQQYELARYQVQQYNTEIDELNKQYLAGKYSLIEYQDRLADLSKSQWNAVNASESIKDTIVDLNETRINESIDGINEEIDAYRELIEAQIDALRSAKDLHDYEQSIAEKTKSITDLERQIAAMQNDNSAATVAKRKLLQEQLAEAKKDLEETEYEHSIQAQEDVLNKQLEDYEKSKNDEIEALKASLEERETLLIQSFNTVKENAGIIGQEIASMATQHGITVSDAIITAWQNGEGAIASYGAVLSENSSAFIGNLMDVESEVYGLQEQANMTADSLSYMFATRADNLVNELTSSYYSEANLNAMTQALHDSLINTLEGGYNVGGITSALDSIASSANSVAEAANNAAKALANMGAVQADVANNKVQRVEMFGSGATANFAIKDANGNYIKNYTSSDDFKKYLKGYASGTRNAKAGLRVTDEQGNELVLPKLSEGRYAIGNAGDQILTKVQTDNIFDWAKFSPTDLVPYNMFGSLNMTPPEIRTRDVNNNTPVQIGNLISVQGNIDSSNIKQMESIANKAVDNLVYKMSKGIKYGRI